ncbi:MAG TPA: hypothetical protein VEM95_05980, partial [Thermoplasmata archaeon]|nr:hypothetical protein [Thermoplasmata archaeon]
MMRGDASGRIPFSLVAVLLLLSAGMSALYAAKLDRDESHARMQEARFAAMLAVADDVHREVLGQAQYVALRAIGAGTDALLNETRVTQAFDAGFREYLASWFPRIVRGVAVSISQARSDLALVQRRVVDQVPSNASRVELVAGVRIETPDLDAPDATASVDRLVYFEVHGLVNYTLALDGMVIHEPRALTSLVPLPAPFMERKLTQATRSGTGDLSGVGRTVKAILASVVQFRVLDGTASLMRPGTTTRDLLTPSDVELAVNLALLLEEIRRFHAYDRDAAIAIDAAHAPPSVPDGFLPPTQDRTLVRLLDRYAASGTLDAVDLYALYTGLDAKGLSLASLFAQAIAALQDDAALRTLDYFGLTPLLDWINAFAEQLANWVDGFWRWATGEPSKEVEYMHGYVQAVFTDTGVGTSFFGPQRVALPDRSYVIGNGSGTLTITVPAHIATVPFRTLDLLGKECDSLWQAYFPNLKSRVGAVDASLRNMVNDIATRIAKDAVVSGLLPASATGPLDPKDNISLLDALGERVGKAVDDALAYFLESPQAVDALMSNLWNATKALLGDLVDTLAGFYDTLVLAPLQEGFAGDALADDLMAAAANDPDYASLNLAQYIELRGAIASDVV